MHEVGTTRMYGSSAVVIAHPATYGPLLESAPVQIVNVCCVYVMCVIYCRWHGHWIHCVPHSEAAQLFGRPPLCSKDHLGEDRVSVYMWYVRRYVGR